MSNYPSHLTASESGKSRSLITIGAVETSEGSLGVLQLISSVFGTEKVTPRSLTLDDLEIVLERISI